MFAKSSVMIPDEKWIPCSGILHKFWHRHQQGIAFPPPCDPWQVSTSGVTWGYDLPGYRLVLWTVNRGTVTVHVSFPEWMHQHHGATIAVMHPPEAGKKPSYRSMHHIYNKPDDREEIIDCGRKYGVGADSLLTTDDVLAVVRQLSVLLPEGVRL